MLVLDKPITIMDRARQCVMLLAQLGLPLERQAEAVALIHESLTETEAEARRRHRHEMYADMLVEAVPREVLMLAAEKIVSRGY